VPVDTPIIDLMLDSSPLGASRMRGAHADAETDNGVGVALTEGREVGLCEEEVDAQ
jgi:hypothetical protein